MPLIVCPDCGKQFSDSAPACPNCGFVRPVQQGVLRIERKMQLNSGAIKTTVFVDGMQYGSLRPGKSLEIPLEPGRHNLEVARANGGNSSGLFDVGPGEEVYARISFGVMGGLNVDVS